MSDHVFHFLKLSECSITEVFNHFHITSLIENINHPLSLEISNEFQILEIVIKYCITNEKLISNLEMMFMVHI